MLLRFKVRDVLIQEPRHALSSRIVYRQASQARSVVEPIVKETILDSQKHNHISEKVIMPRQ